MGQRNQHFMAPWIQALAIIGSLVVLLSITIIDALSEQSIPPMAYIGPSAIGLGLPIGDKLLGVGKK